MTRVRSVLGVDPHHVDSLGVMTKFWSRPDFGVDWTWVWTEVGSILECSPRHLDLSEVMTEFG